MKINFFKKENNFKKKNFSLNPNLYWKLAVGGTLLVALLAAFFGYRYFLQIDREPTFSASDENGQIPNVEQDRIEKALNYFSAKEKKSAEILNFPAPVVDPSR